ncbi:MAG: hypothetical protein AAGH41_13975 [Pseudomonadota bacterium]
MAVESTYSPYLGANLFIGFAQVLAAVATFVVAIGVWLLHRRRNREAIRGRVWAAQVAINVELVRSDAFRAAAEALLEGRLNRNFRDKDIELGIVYCFMQINKIFLLWNGLNSFTLDRGDVIEEIHSQLSLISKSRNVVKFCLERGYCADFRKFILDELAKMDSTPYRPRSFQQFIQDFKKEDC